MIQAHLSQLQRLFVSCGTILLKILLISENYADSVLMFV